MALVSHRQEMRQHWRTGCAFSIARLALVMNETSLWIQNNHETGNEKNIWEGARQCASMAGLRRWVCSTQLLTQKSGLDRLWLK